MGADATPLRMEGSGVGDAVCETVAEVVRETHPRAPATEVRLDSRLEDDLGLDSLALTELLGRIEDRFGVVLGTPVLGTAQTPGDLVAAIDAADRGAQRRTAPALRVTPPSPLAATPEEAETLLDVLRWHVDAHPDRLHLRLIDAPHGAEELSYGTLLESAEAVARGLRTRELERGSKVAIMLPTSLEYFAAFLGVLLADAVPVPIYPPVRLARLEEHIRRQVGILDNAGASVLITMTEARRLSLVLRAGVEPLRHVVTVEELATSGSDAVVPASGPGDVALIQYTSGSTADPKGVVLTHANLLANINAMLQAARVDPTDVFVSWLPLYHDMGLIGAWLTALYRGYRVAFMSPTTFLTRPASWLRAISEEGGTLSASPNFGYELCLRRASDGELSGVDLSSWRIAFNGAEPVSPHTVERFIERFAPWGFRREALWPVYGLAESSVGLAFPPPGRGPVIDTIAREGFVRSGHADPTANDDRTAMRFVACGRPLPGHEIRVVDAADRPVAERVEGAIQFRGPSATSGYHRSPEQTRRLFHGPWLETGDLGYLADGDLYVTGRSKDLIIRAGRNLHPTELEEAVGDLRGIRKGCVAVFGSRDATTGTERLVVVAETRETDPPVRAVLRRTVNTATIDLLGTPPDEVVLAPPGAVLKTSSGKIRRAATRERYEQGSLGPGEGAWEQVVRLAWSGVAAQLLRWGRAAGRVSFGLYTWTLFLAVAVPVWLAVVALRKPSRRWRVLRAGVRTLLALSGMRPHIEGSQRLPTGGAYVVVANHSSMLDGLMLIVTLPDEPVFVAGELWGQRRLTGPFLRAIGARFVERTARVRAVADAERLVEPVRGGRILVVFPEGGLLPGAGLKPFRMGAFASAARTGVPVVPIAIRGTHDALPPHRRWPRLADIRVEIGRPIRPEGSDWPAAVRQRDTAHEVLLRYLA